MLDENHDIGLKSFRVPMISQKEGNSAFCMQTTKEIWIYWVQ